VAAVVPLAGGTFLYVDTPGERGADAEERLGVLAELGRLISAQLPEPEPAASDGEAEGVPGLVGRSEPMCRLADVVRRAALSELPVHIFGETGTGKERVARALHALSRRARGPFVAINAASLSDELLESQLFGHVRGSFSGAVQDAPGLVVAAEGGVLFIDEVVDLSPKGQAKLLRFLQDGEYQRLGESRARHANVRVLTAANVTLAERVREGRFREDLMYRLDALTLGVPALRERGEDVLLLARHFLKAAAARDGVPAPSLPADVARALRAHRWPGNVRELENEMARLVAVTRGRTPRREDLGTRVLEAERTAGDGRSFFNVRLAFEREHVEAALRRSQGNRTRAAADLGITRQALYDKMRRLGLPSAPRA
jgi:two-component system NtrC family response regulator